MQPKSTNQKYLKPLSSSTRQERPVQTDPLNKLFNLATNFVHLTNKCLFLTGKAGTGKTTFLKHIRETTSKKTVIVAPTGVAAINAGGTTIHSFFQLPFGPFIPDNIARFQPASGASDKHSIFSNIRFTKEKIRMLQELQLLIMDEVSMVRCDVIDSIDAILRHFRRQPFTPFGGVQLLFIGDMFQLPPVMPPSEWQLLKDHYENPYFFSARVVRESPPLFLELKKIYRQNEQHFINILNRVRKNDVEWEDLETLHERYNPAFQPAGDDHYIVVSTHNQKVDAINGAQLKKLNTPLRVFEGVLKGEFSEKALPTEQVLGLREGAQVMFVKNDTEPARRYYNGKLAKIISMEGNEIRVQFQDGGKEMTLEKATWENISYSLDPKSGEITEQVLGTFTQYPVKLAWAITVHKSQGLTFEKAILDIGSSFAPGQVYVALSRCTSLEGLVLHSQIARRCIITDPAILAFAEKQRDDDMLEEILEEEIRRGRNQELLVTYEFKKLALSFYEHIEHVKLIGSDGPPERIFVAQGWIEKLIYLNELAQEFQKELIRLTGAQQEAQDSSILKARLQAATGYLSNYILVNLNEPIQALRLSLRGRQMKNYMKNLKVLERQCDEKIRQMRHILEISLLAETA